jgi:hypothetical protein
MPVIREPSNRIFEIKRSGEVALANKNARVMSPLLSRGENYRAAPLAARNDSRG